LCGATNVVSQGHDIDHLEQKNDSSFLVVPVLKNDFLAPFHVREDMKGEVVV